jgi:hypothetical protein
MLSVHSLKVDCTALANDQNYRNQYLVVENINIPERYVYNLIEYEAVLNRIKNFLTVKFSRPNLLPVHFQLTAVYNLVHTVTNAVRVWTGSFFPRGNSIASLTTFVAFEPETFVNFVQRQTTREFIENKLKANNQDSNWEFDSLISVIVNSQANVPLNCSLLTERELTTLQNGRRKRIHRSFVLP